MIKKILSLTLCGLLMMTSNTLLVSAQIKADIGSSAASKVKAKIAKRGTGENKRVKIKLTNGTKISGYINQSSDDSFELTDAKTRQTTSINYTDVDQVNDSGISKGAKIGIIAGLAAGAAIILGLVLTRYCNEQAC